MAKCAECNQEMTDKKVKSCTVNGVKIEGKWYTRDTVYFDKNKRCHDCGIENKPGNVHHCGCDMERCPKCGGQMISCDCVVEELGRICGECICSISKQ
jgi:hypothetical protein